MKYISENETVDGRARVVYEGKTTGKQEPFTATDWLARLVTHITEAMNSGRNYTPL